eukprot:UN14433
MVPSFVFFALFDSFFLVLFVWLSFVLRFQNPHNISCMQLLTFGGFLGFHFTYFFPTKINRMFLFLVIHSIIFSFRFLPLLFFSFYSGQ